MLQHLAKSADAARGQCLDWACRDAVHPDFFWSEIVSEIAGARFQRRFGNRSTRLLISPGAVKRWLRCTGRLAEEAGLADPTGLADKWQILMSGAIVLALAGELDAALRSREVAALLLERVGRSEAPV